MIFVAILNVEMLNCKKETIFGRTIVLRLHRSSSHLVFSDFKSGLQLFKSFRNENSSSFWDPHLQESVKSLKYIGLLRPCTLLIGGDDLPIDTIIASWSRRTLLPPCGFSIESIGTKSLKCIHII